MKGDFSRDTFDKRKHFSRVLYQQGRLSIDADPNEQTSIVHHYLRTLACDLIGPHGGPAGNLGLKLSETEDGDLLIGKGRYYVDGILIENENAVSYLSQPDYPVPDDDALRHAIKGRQQNKSDNAAYPASFLYLDVWERHITPIEDDYIREKSLGGTHTCTRAKVIWQVRAVATEGGVDVIQKMKVLGEERQGLSDLGEIEELDAELAALNDELANHCDHLVGGLASSGGGLLAARANPERVHEELGETAPDTKYRGPENRLYRLEIHRGGRATDPTHGASFKWSRDNGSIATAWLATVGNELQVANADGFDAGAWVELCDDRLELRGEPGTLVKLTKVEGDRLSIDTDGADLDALAWSEELINPKARCWSQTTTGGIELSEGAVPVREVSLEQPAEEGGWIDLEDGIQVQFTTDGEYRTGDYWLIPARAATGDIEWSAGSKPHALAPHGVKHHYAPIGFVTWRDGEFGFASCLRAFDVLAT